MAGDSTKIKLGAAWVTFGTVAGNVGEVVDLGYTKGGVTITMDTTVYEITVDQEGTSPVAATILGRRATVDFSMAESNYQRLQKIVPESTYSSGLLDINSGIGADLMNYEDELVVTSKASAQDYIKLYSAVPVTSLRATFAPDGERLWPVQFIGLIESGTSKLLGLHEAT
ncbi:MAG: hypothetical protein ACFFCZ_20290 [Promethearchaeota archaeon]